MKRFFEIAGILALVALGWILGTFYPVKSLQRLAGWQERRDTTYFHDTTFVDKPVPVEVTPLGYELIPIGTMDRIAGQIQALEDSLEKKPRIVKKDSLIYIEVPMEQKHFTDSTTYDAWVSGYKPRLDSLRIFSASMQIDVTNTPPTAPRKRFGFGIQGGMGIQYDMTDKQFGVGPYLGIGIDWRF